MSFSFSFVANKRERKERKERENTPLFSTLLRALIKMDVAGRACTFTLAKKRSQRNCRSFICVYIYLKEKRVFHKLN